MGLNLLNVVIGLIKGSSRWSKASKCKSLIKQLKNRLTNQKSRRIAIVRQSREDIAQLLNNGQYGAAQARVELLYKDQCKLSAYNQLEEFCDCVCTNIQDLNRSSKLSTEVLEAVSSLMFAASRCGELPELHSLRSLFRHRFGHQFDEVNVKLLPGNAVNSDIKHNLTVKAVSRDVILQLKQDIEEEYKLHPKNEGNLGNKLYDHAAEDWYVDFEHDDKRSFTLEEMLQKLGRLCYPNNANSGTFWGSCKSSTTGQEVNSKDSLSVNLSSNSYNKKVIVENRSRAALTSRCTSPRRQDRDFLKNEEGTLRSPLSHVHPKLPDYDELVKEFTYARKNHVHRISSYQEFQKWIR